MAKRASTIHPGEFLLTELMEPLGLTAYRLAKELHVPQPPIHSILRGKRSSSADTSSVCESTSNYPPNSGWICKMNSTRVARPLTHRTR